MIVNDAKTITENIDDFIDVPDGIKRLRSEVLSLAVSGKLVPQDSSEGAAEELYEKIQKEKAKAEERGRTRRVKELTSVSNEENPPEIPETWKLVRLGDVSEFQYGKGLEKKDRKELGKYIAYGANGPKARTDLYNCEITGIVIGRKGTAGAVNLVEGPFYATDVTYFIPEGQFGAFDINYLEILLLTLNLPKLAQGTKPGLNRNSAYEKAIGLPPAAEQSRIVKKVNELMRVIYALEAKKKERDHVRTALAKSAFHSLGLNDPSVALEEMNELVRDIDDVKEMEKGILSLAVSGKLVAQDPSEGAAEELYEKIQKVRVKAAKESGKKLKTYPSIDPAEIPFEIPKSWQWVRLGNIVQLSSGVMLAKKNMKDGVIPVFGGNGFAGFHNESNTSSEVIIVGRVGAQCGNVHITETNTWVTDNAFKVRFLDRALYYRFVALALKQLNLGSTYRGSAQPVISGASVYPLLFALPPLAEQKRIVEKVDELMGFVSQLKTIIKDD